MATRNPNDPTGPTAYPAGPVTTVSPSRGRSSWIWLIGVVIVVALVLGWLFWWPATDTISPTGTTMAPPAGTTMAPPAGTTAVPPGAVPPPATTPAPAPATTPIQ